ncbi:MAG: SIMPL domain-containing protein, partial [Limnohabitans sp.]|nr:SIMPL domain-containing protein [Limnohabitans sp.]
KKILFYLSLAFSLIGTQLQAQQENVNSIVAPEKSRIEVIGTAELWVEPDIIYVSIVLREKELRGETVSVESLEEKLKTELKSNNINIENLSLTDANTEVFKIRKSLKKVLSSKEYNLKLTNFKDVKTVFYILDKLEVQEAKISRTDVSNRIEILKNTRIEAIKAAKNKAQYLLQAIGLDIDKPIFIKEVTDFDLFDNRSNRSNTYTKQYLNVTQDSSDLNNELSIQKICITSKMLMEYAIK